MGRASLALRRMRTKRCQAERSPSVSALSLRRKFFLSLKIIKDVHVGEEWLCGGSGGIGEDDVFEFVVAGRQDGSALVDFSGIEQVEHRKMLDGEDFVHAFEAEAALAVKEVGDVGLFESGLLRQPESGQFTCFDSPQRILRRLSCRTLNFIKRSIASGILRGNGAHISTRFAAELRSADIRAAVPT